MSLFSRKKRRKEPMTRVFFATDIHGSDPAFFKFLNAAEHYQADALVLGGDITGKMVISIIRRPGGWEANLFEHKYVLETESELAELEKIIRTNGFYPYRTTEEEVRDLEADPEKVDALFLRLMKESVARWMDVAEDKLKGRGVRSFISLGNDDRDEIIPVIEGSEVMTYADGKAVWLDELHEMVSVGHGNMTPWHCPRDLPEGQLAERIEAAISQAKDPTRALFNFHVPPYDSELDLGPQLDNQLRPVLVGGQPNIVPLGSTAVREAIERYQPLAGLHGHIHESRGASKIGRTICINPGSEYSEGILRGVLLNLRDGQVVSYQLISG